MPDGLHPLIPEDKIDDLRRPQRVQARDDTHDFQCEDCGCWITVGKSGVEYGHERGRGGTGPAPRCPRRPDCVDPQRSGPQHDDWSGPKRNRFRRGSA